ncbi:MAG: terminase small subunit [Patescibacteria group bacterium]|nr:terminase small subunit [Patescibacteria group bacterium]
MALTLKQQRFIKDYLETGNATEAAARNYKVANRHTAEVIGFENLRKPEILMVVGQYTEDLLPMDILLNKLSQTIFGPVKTAQEKQVQLNAIKIGCKLLGLFDKYDKEEELPIRIIYNNK